MSKEELPSSGMDSGMVTEIDRQNPNLWQVVWKWMVLFWLALVERLGEMGEEVYPSDEREY